MGNNKVQAYGYFEFLDSIASGLGTWKGAGLVPATGVYGSGTAELTVGTVVGNVAADLAVSVKWSASNANNSIEAQAIDMISKFRKGS